MVILIPDFVHRWSLSFFPTSRFFTACIVAAVSVAAPGRVLAEGGEYERGVFQIQNQAEPGTGFFLQVGKNVIFITANHVLGSTGEDVTIRISADESITIPLSDQVPISSVDAAALIVRRIPESVKPMAASLDPLRQGESLTVLGYPVTTQSISPRLTIRNGQYIGAPRKVEDGYSILYTAQTQIGFSGGPIVDRQGKVVGIHGRAELETSSLASSRRTGNALGIPIADILTVISGSGTKEGQINEKALNESAAKASMRRVFDTISGSAMSDQVLQELSRAEKGSIPKYCIEMTRAYYYTFFSSLPDLEKARLSLTINKTNQQVSPAYFALASLISRKAGDFDGVLAYTRILERLGQSRLTGYSERRLIEEFKIALEQCSSL